MEEDVGLAEATSPEVLDAAAAPVRPIEAYELSDYLRQLVQVALSADDDAHSLVSSSDASDLCLRFINDPLCQAIYVIKKRSQHGDNKDGTPRYSFSYSIQPELVYSDALVSSLAIIKRLPVISADHSLPSQLQILSLPGPAAQDAPKPSVNATQINPYEALHACIHLAVNPYFDAYVKSRSEHEVVVESASDKRNLGKNSKTGIPAVRRKFAELEQGLLQMQQTVEIPKITFAVHPDVMAIVEAAKAANRKPLVEHFGDTKLKEEAFLTQLQMDVNSWVKDIERVTSLVDKQTFGQAAEEINFWLSMERAVDSIDVQLKSEPILLTVAVLEKANRRHATTKFSDNSDLIKTRELVSKYNMLMKDFPLNELLSATDPERCHEAIMHIFNHLNRKLRSSPYPSSRVLLLVEAISRDLNDQLLKVLGSRRLMYLDYEAFEKATTGLDDVFSAWDEQVKAFITVVREVTRKRNKVFMALRVHSAHAQLQHRIGLLRTFRKYHEQLRQTIARAMTRQHTTDKDEAEAAAEPMGAEDVDAVEEVSLAYEFVKNIDVLDVSPEGTEIWVDAETAYNERVSRVENQIIANLRDRLGTAKNSNEMFRVFSKFNTLFVRPKIRGAIQEYQTQLIDSVKEDIKRLQEKFTRQYRTSEAYHMSQLRDLPPISGTIVWARQIEHQLQTYMRRVEDVLGKGWELYAEGERLQKESNDFRQKLDARPVFESWLHDINQRGLNVSGRIFEITRNRAMNNSLQLGVNFDEQVITLFKEVRSLVWLGFPVPYSISNIAKDAKRVYPFAVSLRETTRTYSQTVYKVQQHGDIASLVAGYHRAVQQMVSKGINLRWDFYVNVVETFHRPLALGQSSDSRMSRHVQFVREFANVVSVYQDKVDALIGYHAEIANSVQELQRCPYRSEKLTELLERIQKLVDRLSLEGYSNLEAWVQALDRKIESVLRMRLQQAVRLWMHEFQNAGQDQGVDRELARKKQLRRRGQQAEDDTDEADAQPALEVLVHEICIRNQVMYLDPPIEQGRANWYQQLHAWLAIICHLPRVQSSRYEIGLNVHGLTEHEQTYASLLTRMDDDSLERAYDLIERKVKEVGDYVNIWLQYQSLWDLESNYVLTQLSDDLAKWQQILLEIKKARGTFDNAETEKSFGSMIVDYEQVQSKVNAKYDAWQRELLNKFGAMLGNSMREFHSAVSKARGELEQHSADSTATSEAVSFITLLQDLKKKVNRWNIDVDLFRQGQKTLERQRYQFQNDWLYVDQIEGEWSAFNEILTRKNNAIQEQVAGLQMKIIAEDKVIEEKIRTLVGEWEGNKPVQGDIKPDIATNTLNIFEGRVTRAKDEYDAVCRAKEALDLELTSDNRLEPVLEELRDLKSVWSALSNVWQSVYEIKDTLWSTVVPRKIREQLNGLMSSAKEMPSRMRQYAAFEYMQETIRGYIKVNALLIELKSDALRERHWRQLFKMLRADKTILLSEMTVGHLWDFDLKRNEQVVREVITIAQGEMALEEFLKQVKETWTSYVLELVNYQNKCRLIKGWDDLFAKCSEHLNSLQAMKISPYYKVFEEDAASWEEKLNRVHVLFDVWIDVQRQWVYLEGIFSGSADIKHLLPVETSRFQNINSEFLTVMKKVYKSPFVMDILNIQNIQKSLERLADLLSKIQKALGEYLERERSSFPRFYFVGDEDLLEIIGNSKDVMRIQKHFKKMFAGISNIVLSEDLSTILGMASREGEEVMFKTPVSIKENPKINDWLTLLEKEMRMSLALLLGDAVVEMTDFFLGDELGRDAFLSWIDRFPAQLVVLAAQAVWTQLVEKALTTMAESGSPSHEPLNDALAVVARGLNLLADTVLTDLPQIKRRKCEHLITELVHQRDVIRLMMQDNIASPKDFNWLYQMRFYYTASTEDPLQRLTINMANATFFYGYEYLGVPDRLVQTPLTDRCYLTLTQALEGRLGGSPFGPAGTGKTESVKALGVQLGRFVLVFCCDDTFDFQAMGRIFVGLCMVGAWGCFDEFNRLEERILSAVSQQVQSIQLGLREIRTNPNHEVELVGKNIKINSDTGIFITMNPGYAGRSNLPDNLKKLFRSMAMTKPDRELIAQVMLYSQGFRTAELLASKVVPLFNLCSEQLSPQSHYDFGLRALKSVLVTAGNLKRDRLQSMRKALASGNVADGGLEQMSEGVSEQEILIQSIRETMVPKLVADDIPLLQSLLSDVFPGVEYRPVDLDRLRAEIGNVCKERNLVAGEFWMEKVLQLYQIQNINHGLMMVGPSGSGKSKAWQVLLAAMERVEGVEGISYVIDPKAMSKELLYGTLDPTTREWTDGLFTHILRKIVDNVRGESTKRHWIIFDGDVDPEWVENLNSVLDDNRLLTLPNGERLGLPPNVRIMFEVENLKYATLATVSRCGMVWFSEDVVTLPMIFTNYLEMIRTKPLDDVDDDLGMPRRTDSEDQSMTPTMIVQLSVATVLEQYFVEDGLVSKTLDHAAKLTHIMDFTRTRVLTTLFSLLNKTIRNIVEYNAQHIDFPMSNEHLETYVSKRIIYSLIWSFSGDAKLDLRAELGEYVRGITTIDLPMQSAGGSVLDYDIDVKTSDWIAWETKVPTIEIETQTVSQADVVIPTMDTVRHEEVLYSWLSEHKPLMLCGPPGSGKTMTLFSALRKLPDMEVVGLNFSSATTPELILKTFEQYCEYRKTPNGVILSPILIGKWLVVFCDEINLPATDKYGTQRVISFLRQLIECNGFWRTSDKAWVTLERIQFVGACNPPTDPGRVPLSHRFMRHAPLVMVDYPGEISLKQIYGTFTRAMLKVVPTLRGYAEPLTSAMVEFYLMSQRHFTPDIQAHYIYSPRELTRWMRGIFEAIKPLETLSVEGLVRIWAHEALRLFQDRLVTEEERKWTDDNIDEVAMRHFPSINQEEALLRPILYSNWLSKDYIPVEREELRDFVKARLKVFYEEELDVPLVLFNDVLEHVLRIDRVFRQMQGHLLLIGVSGSGKTTLSRFCAWMNGLSVFQIKAHNKYTGEDFDEDLRTVLRRAGCKAEKICFIMDESNVLDSGFLERMNTLLANAEVPGLFEGDEYASLMTQCKEGAQKEGLMLDSHDELYKWFTQQVMKNLHVVFTMNPPEGGLSSRAATSPALFNRCVLDWFGDWSDQAFFQVGKEFTHSLDLDRPLYAAPSTLQIAYRDLPMPPTYRDAVVNAFVFVHQSLYEINAKVSKRQGRYNYATPRHFLDFINHYVRLFNEKRDDLEEQQRHLNIGLEKLRDTVVQVEELRKSLAIKKNELEAKNQQANEKLKKMVADQQEAEQKKSASIKFQEALKQQNKQIETRRKVVMQDLANAEPAVIEAQNAVSGIKKQQLTEVRSMANPPVPVKLAMESVCTLLGHKFDSWRSIQQIIRRDDFISSILNYDTERMMTRQLREKMKRDYMSNSSYNFETVDRASRACGPLVKWAIAQVNYSEILDRVGPLRQEVYDLEQSAEDTKVQAASIEEMIGELEASIARYKDEYAMLISEVQAIKLEMERVKSKVDRSVMLLDSLSSEKERWEAGSQTFETQMATIVGDVLLSAAFMAYGGYFDQHYREMLSSRWSEHLVESSILFKKDLSLTEYLSSADERLGWQANSLPADDLCTENAIMLKRFNRYPLIIDPSGQATAFLVNEYKDRKITVTSFLDDAFLKNLESALRFGNPLLIQDVENLDPILNPVLNKELRRTGGRVLIRLGGQDIDFSPSFTLFLSTRDPSVNFPPDVCSRVTFVNFTVTRSSLQSQCLNKVLKVERPDVDKKRTDLIKLQGEFKLRLRHLEKSLLQALSETTGNILDDDNIITTLETLKKEAAEVSRKVEETDSIMQEVDDTTKVYTPLAHACSSIYFVMEQLNLLNHFYQFSLDFFYDIFNYVLNENPNLKTVTDPEARLEVLARDLFYVTYQRVTRTLLHQDHLAFSMLLSQIKTRGTPFHVDETEYDFLLSGGELVPGSQTVSATELGLPSGILDDERTARLREYTRLPCFRGLVDHMCDNEPDWVAFLESNEPETCVPVCWEGTMEGDSTVDLFRRLLLIKCLRPDRLLPAASLFVQRVFDASFVNQSELNFRSLVLDEVRAGMPVALCSIPGYDASYRVDNLAAEVNVRCTSVAMGSAEGFAHADQAITTAVKTGTWVLLKNVHLAPSWLGQLEKRLHSLKPHRSFRLFLTMETNPKVPVNLLRMSRSLRSIPAARLSKGPTERARLYFLLAWLHAVVQERLRYVPIGWTKIYEFNDSDQDCALNTIDSWLDAAAQGRANISPERIPWDAIRTLLSQSVYGGRIDNEFDQKLLESFVNTLFTPASYDIDFALVPAGEDGRAVMIPEGTKMEQFMEWANRLPEREPPSWLGLPGNAERVLLTTKGNALLSNVRRMRSLADDEDMEEEAGTRTATNSQQPSWMRALYTSVQGWMQMLPESVARINRTSESIKSPLFRVFERENQIGRSLLAAIRRDLSDLKLVCEGELKQTNHLRMLMSCLTRGIIPDHWRRYKVPKGVTLTQWIADLNARLQQVANVAGDVAYESRQIWLGGLFIPEAFVTATRQMVAQRNGWSLEELQMAVDLEHSGDESGFAIVGLKIEGARWSEGCVQLTAEPATKLNVSQIRWLRRDDSTTAPSDTSVMLPVYLNGDRSELLFSACIPARASDRAFVAQRGIAIVASF
ncbi:dynein heavy chain [Thamnocephalis sphaerospora]|uniref:Dynein heavy chain, cytoplasmic n=1 Tax=Thamnocephalis sphaerospora TaxID=78915 RepID=A0A4P9XR06_9FUNG|nr:dynein heavy chain [Thamnocephalis sphaerospora]|eukprot:RKP08503.1 dynein heavy chain [Thamnocephalis sphaerospora]